MGRGDGQRAKLVIRELLSGPPQVLCFRKNPLGDGHHGFAGLGDGFSSLTVPVGLVFFANRVLNPALVLIEVFINLYVLIINRAAIRAVWKRVWPIIVGLLPGVALGSYLLASLHPDWLKLATYVLILPLILLQAAGVRRPIGAERV